MKEYMNLGIAKAIVLDNITNEFISESKLDKSKDLATRLIKTIKNSPVLINEFNVIKNIENKHIENDILATKFIDRNLATFSKFTTAEINEAHHQLVDFIVLESIENIDSKRVSLYNSINILINESKNDINAVQDAYENVLKFIKENVATSQAINESDIKIDESIDLDELINIATDKFNKKYSSLNEDEKKIVYTYVYGNEQNKKDLFESLKESNLKSLKSLNTNGIEDKINEALDKLNKMVYSDESFIVNVQELNNLKKNLN